jgi:hypothetical protein
MNLTLIDWTDRDERRFLRKKWNLLKVKLNDPNPNYNIDLLRRDSSNSTDLRTK